MVPQPRMPSCLRHEEVLSPSWLRHQEDLLGAQPRRPLWLRNQRLVPSFLLADFLPLDKREAAMWCPSRRHMLSSKRSYGDFQEVIWCHPRGHMVSSKRSYGVIQEVIRYHPRGHMVSTKRSLMVIQRVMWSHQGGDFGPSKG